MVRENKDISIEEYIAKLTSELKVLEDQQEQKVGDNIKKNEAELKGASEKLNELSIAYDMLSPEISYDKQKLKQYVEQGQSIEEDLRKNKGALKIKALGAELPTRVATDSCPTCHQFLKDSLLPNDINQTPMRIEENISFLDSQLRMVNVFTDGQRKVIREKEDQLSQYQSRIEELRQNIRSLKRELVQDERLPSVMQIEKRLNLKKLIEFYNGVLEDFDRLIDFLKTYVVEFGTLLGKEQSLPSNFFSYDDQQKLATLEGSLVSLLRTFEYSSKPLNEVKVSHHNYLPVIERRLENNMTRQDSIKFSSSASDFIRCIWAYTIALLKCSFRHNGNHPRLLIFDEPKQQDISMHDFRLFLTELSNLLEHQIIVFASFENHDDSFDESTKGLNFKLNRIDQRMVKPIRSSETAQGMEAV